MNPPSFLLLDSPEWEGFEAILAQAILEEEQRHTLPAIVVGTFSLSEQHNNVQSR